MRALITGATGLVGKHLVGKLEDVVVLSRNADEARRRLGKVEAHPWNPEGGRAPAEAFRGVEVVFNLAGEPVFEGRWTEEKKRRIRDSRVVGTRNLVSAIAASESRPKVIVSASAVGYYGDRGDEELDERSSKGDGFLAEVCVGYWEREAIAAAQLGVRVVCVRIGVRSRSRRRVRCHDADSLSDGGGGVGSATADSGCRAVHIKDPGWIDAACEPERTRSVDR